MHCHDVIRIAAWLAVHLRSFSKHSALNNQLQRKAGAPPPPRELERSPRRDTDSNSMSRSTPDNIEKHDHADSSTSRVCTWVRGGVHHARRVLELWHWAAEQRLFCASKTNGRQVTRTKALLVWFHRVLFLLVGPAGTLASSSHDR
jgi:hypothetical protein